MLLTSSAIDSGGQIPKIYTCDGENLSPPLAWSDFPSDARSFALICDDPDAPSGTFHHWALYDIPASKTELAEGADRDPAGQGFKRGLNDFNRLGYGGPCPPHRHGPHRYQFRLLALSIEHLPLHRDPSCRDVEREARKHVLGEAGFVGTYER